MSRNCRPARAKPPLPNPSANDHANADALAGEISSGTIRLLEDTDGDGRVDPDETDPTNPDTDGDGLRDGTEALGDLIYLTDPLSTDSDDDGLSDFDEVQVLFTNPLNPDTDGDGYSDGIEVAKDGDPNNANIKPTGALAIFPAVDVEFYTVNGVKYQLEVSKDMIQWTPQGSPVVGNGGNQNHLVRVGEDPSFWRLKVVP